MAVLRILTGRKNGLMMVEHNIIENNGVSGGAPEIDMGIISGEELWLR